MNRHLTGSVLTLFIILAVLTTGIPATAAPPAPTVVEALDRAAHPLRSLLEAPARSGKGLCRGTGSGHLARIEPGDTVCGCDAPDADFLHADELRAAEADEVRELLGAGARVYVCGDGSRTAPGVREAFRTLYREHTPGADDAAAGRWLDALIVDGRYAEDVYAAG